MQRLSYYFSFNFSNDLWHADVEMDGISYHSFVGSRSTQGDIVFVIGSDEGLKFETSALKLFAVANLRYELNR